MSAQKPSQTASGKGKNLIILNGINGKTGTYYTKPLTVQKLLSGVIQKSGLKKPTKKKGAEVYRLASWYGNANDPGQAGWGVIFPAKADSRQVSKLEEALSPLINYRKSKTPYFKIFKGGDGYRWTNGQGETLLEFLERHGASVGPAEPTAIPYYLLLVGDPNSIPYDFQFDLEGQYAVGRIYFDKLEDYYHYASSVVAAETGQVRLPRQAVFFGTHHKDDEATRLSAEGLIQPMAEFADKVNGLSNLNWQPARVIPPDQASKTKLSALLGGNETPALLFTATHGLEWPYGDERQLATQGALICKEYPGPYDWSGEMERDFYLAGEDIPGDANLLGLVAFHFACFGAGTPYWDDYSIASNAARPALAKRAFLAELPKKLLSHPKGGALAVVGHVERAWSCSFQWPNGGEHQAALREVLFQLLAGNPVGKATEGLNERYTTIAGAWLKAQEELDYEPDKYTPDQIAENWIMAKDARGYAVMGDPAARIPLATAAEPATGHIPLELGAYAQDALPDVMVPESLDEPPRPAKGGKKGGGKKAKGYAAEAGGDQSEAVEEPPAGEPPAQRPARKPTGGAERPPVQPSARNRGGSAERPVVQPVRRQPPASPQQVYAPVTLLDMVAKMNEDYSPRGMPSYGMGEDIKKAMEKVVASLTSAFNTISSKLADFADGVTSLEVGTYTAKDLPAAGGKTPDLSGMKPVAWTKITLTGDMQVMVPMEEGKLNEALWAVHKDMVALAQANRAEMIKASVEALARLIGPVD